MSKILKITGYLILFFLLSFGIVVALDIPILNDPAPLFVLPSYMLMVGSVSLLGLDIFLPVPGSLIMVGNGSYFGFVTGASLSLLGAIISTFLGYFLGKKGNVYQKILSNDEIDNAQKYIQKYGALIIIVTRPIPLLSESICVMAGVTKIPFKKMFIYSLIGYLPSILLYTYAGTSLSESDEYGTYSFIAVIVLAGLFWGIGQLFSKEKWKESTN